jgi:hypothetical protein
MSQSPAVAPRPLPFPLVLVASLAIVAHCFVIVMLALSARSGPWVTSFGDSPAEPPLFAARLTNLTGPAYLLPLWMPSEYHFVSSRTLDSAVYFEAILKDGKGNVIKTLKFPDEKENSWMEHRYAVLARGLGNDLPVEVPRGEVIPAPGKEMRKLTIWDPVPGGTTLRLREVPEHLVPRDRPMVFRPTEWSMLLARSYQRYLAREHGAASVELIRHSRNQIIPAVMFLPEPPPGTFEEMVCSFGEYRHEE